MLRNSCLNGGFVWHLGDGFWDVVLGADGAGLTGLHWLPLQEDVLTSELGGPLLLGVGLDTVDESLTAGRVSDVLNTDVDTLLEVPSSNDLVDDNTDGGLGDVVDDTGLSVVDLVWHTLLDGTVGLDVDDVTNTVLCEVGRHVDHTLLPEVPGEGISGARSETA